MVTIVVDAYGGDDAPSVVLDGVYRVLALQPELRIILTGPVALLSPLLSSCDPAIRHRIECVDAPQIVGMGDAPAKAFRDKPCSSIRVGIDWVKEKRADAFVSAGNTGAVMATATLRLGRLPGIERPCIATIMPGHTHPFVMVDMGASVDSKPSHLEQFASLGSAYATSVLQVSSPRVGLLNIGEEAGKGNQLSQTVYSRLHEVFGEQFVGNVEGKQLFNGVADVVVTDGFVGNALLKFGEGIADLFFGFFRSQARRSWRTLGGLWLLKPFLKRFHAQYDYRQYGGAPLLGVNGVVVIAHGRSDATAICYAILQAHRCVVGQLVPSIESGLSCP